ncbi:MAG: hypothetical protein ACI80S_001141 [Pseudohongiellaceae bacterium]|jgi:hypothetical protein
MPAVKERINIKSTEEVRQWDRPSYASQTSMH